MTVHTASTGRKFSPEHLTSFSEHSTCMIEALYQIGQYVFVDPCAILIHQDAHIINSMSQSCLGFCYTSPPLTCSAFVMHPPASASTHTTTAVMPAFAPVFTPLPHCFTGLGSLAAATRACVRAIVAAVLPCARANRAVVRPHTHCRESPHE